MRRTLCALLTCGLLLANPVVVSAADDAPWGSASVLDIDYAPQKVLYDLFSGDEKDITSILDRVGYLYRLYGSDNMDSSIVVIIHGDAIPFFARREFKKYEAIMRRAQSLAMGTSIEFRMCRAAARLLKYEARDIHGFVKMVPMADAEIMRLQHENYAYMQ
ncbi:MAG: DsrE family protein [Gammaproteobacteria bacterium]